MTMGATRVLCSATVDEGVPRWMVEQQIPGGWVNGEYVMLQQPLIRTAPLQTGSLGMGTQEIRRLIGRSLRAALDLRQIGDRTVTVSCDVLHADGGSRTAAITGGYVAMNLALNRLIREGVIPITALRSPLAAVSVGMIGEEAFLDLTNDEDSRADVDINVVMNAAGEFIEVQGSAEFQPIHRNKLETLLNLAGKGIQELLAAQKTCLGLTD